jgi:hypothetical protein
MGRVKASVHNRPKASDARRILPVKDATGAKIDRAAGHGKITGA